MSQKRRAGPVSVQQLISVAALVLAIFILVVLAQRMTTSLVLWRQTEQVQLEINSAKAETIRLEKRKGYVQTDEYIESVARRDMKMLRPGEIAVIGVPTQLTPTPPAPREWWQQVIGR